MVRITMRAATDTSRDPLAERIGSAAGLSVRGIIIVASAGITGVGMYSLYIDAMPSTAFGNPTRLPPV